MKSLNYDDLVDIESCFDGEHDMYEIMRDSRGEFYSCVRWCGVCGAVRVDQEAPREYKPGPVTRYPKLVPEDKQNDNERSKWG